MYDNGLWVDKDLEGGGRGLYGDTVPELIQRSCEKLERTWKEAGKQAEIRTGSLRIKV
jgi:hypothetical protein